MRYRLRHAIVTATLLAGALPHTPVWADSFDRFNPSENRRVPVMQYGTYNPSPEAPVAKPIPISPSGRPCCRNNSTPRWYIGAIGLVVFLQDEDVELQSPLLAGGRKTDSYTTDLGYGFAVNAGYRITPEIRAELELARRQNDLDKLNGATPTLPNGTYSAQKSTAYMANLYYDYDTGTSYSPYLGAGAGMAFVKSPVYYPNASQFLKEWTFAYQFMAGVSYKLQTDFNQIVFHFGYRYFTSDELETDFRNVPATASFSNDSHNLELGGKFYF